jgi:hypothetical protein
MIQNYVDELNNIKTEIIRNNVRNKGLKKRAIELETNILSYLREKEQDGVKYKGRAIMVERKEKFKQNRKLKEEVSVNYLREIGVPNPEIVYKRLLDTQRGEAIEKESLKIKNLK